MTNKSTDPIYQLKVTLRGSKPPIWRRLLVPGSCTLAELHGILQVSMGWYDSHLHLFTIGETDYSTPFPEDWPPVKDERRYRLKQVAPSEKMKFLYVYDFGDGWEHEILVEKILPREHGGKYPLCIKGKLACPPDDVGGIGGYYFFLEAMSDPNHPEHDHYLEWWGTEFDPEEFSIEDVNLDLQQKE
jgi:hypothetical protein